MSTHPKIMVRDVKSVAEVTVPLRTIDARIQALSMEANYVERYAGAPKAHEIDEYLVKFGFKRVLEYPVHESYGDTSS